METYKVEKFFIHVSPSFIHFNYSNSFLLNPLQFEVWGGILTKLSLQRSLSLFLSVFFCLPLSLSLSHWYSGGGEGGIKGKYSMKRGFPQYLILRQALFCLDLLLDRICTCVYTCMTTFTELAQN